MALAEHLVLRVSVIGGRAQPRHAGGDRRLGVAAICERRADICFLGVCALHPELGITTTDLEERHVKRAMIDASAQVVALAGPGKPGSAAPFVVGSLDDLTHLVADDSAPPDVLAAAASAAWRWCRRSSAPRRARAVLTLVFAANGVAFGTFAARVPAIKDRLELGDGELGLALLFIAAGALVAFPVAGRLIASTGSRPVTRAGLCLMPAALALVALAPSLPTLMGAALAFGAANATLDVAMNAHGVAVERALGRPIMSSLHAGWSIGGLVGAGLGGLLAAGGVDARVNLIVVPAAVCGLALVATRALLPAAEDIAPALPALRLPSPRIALLGVIAFCSLFAEGVAADWSAVYLEDSLATTSAVAATGFAAYSLAMAGGRLVGDRLTLRWGPSGLLVRCGLLASAGLGIALLIGHPAAAIVGFALLGAGVAPVVPVVFRAGGSVPGVPSSQGIATVSWLGYLGFLAGPPIIGLTADAIGLPAALGIVCGMTAAVAVLAGTTHPAPAIARSEVPRAA